MTSPIYIYIIQFSIILLFFSRTSASFQKKKFKPRFFLSHFRASALPAALLCFVFYLPVNALRRTSIQYVAVSRYRDVPFLYPSYSIPRETPWTCETRGGWMKVIRGTHARLSPCIYKTVWKW